MQSSWVSRPRWMTCTSNRSSGPEASTLIHEVSTAIAAGGDATTLAEKTHVHPALSEVVQGAFREVRPVAPEGV